MTNSETIILAHGSGGKAMRELIEQVFLQGYGNDLLATLEDQARLDLAPLLAQGDRLAMTTDAYVVDPLYFPGGDIGKLAVTGTVNDLAVGGATPHYLSCSMIIEEGLELAELRRVVASMAEAANAAGVQIVTGDTKVVPRGSADKLFITTTGIGVIPTGISLGAHRARPGDVILVNGPIGDHGAAILAARGELALDSTIASDCQPLNTLVQSMLKQCPDIRCLRDATRGGIASVLNEFAQASACAMRLDEASLPIRETVRGMCEILGLDPLYLANEGKLVAIVPASQAEDLLAVMRNHPAGSQAACIGKVTAQPAATVILHTAFGGERIIDPLPGEQLPRIC